MKLRQNRVLFVTWLVLGGAVLGEAGLLVERIQAARGARKERAKVEREWRTWAATRPAPTAENTGLIEVDLARVGRELAAVRAGLSARSGMSSGSEVAVLSGRAEAFFNLAQFVEETRTRAQLAGVRLRADEHFGFSRYTHDAPETGQIAAVMRDQVRLKCLLDALLEAQPAEIISVQCEAPVAKVDEARRATPDRPVTVRTSPVAGAEYFALDPRISRRVPGLVETAAFRLSFAGRTPTLRTLLNKLAAMEPLVVVRTVEVASADQPRGVEQPAGPGPMSLIGSSWSRFTVTVEFIELAPKSAARF